MDNEQRKWCEKVQLWKWGHSNYREKENGIKIMYWKNATEGKTKGKILRNSTRIANNHTEKRRAKEEQQEEGKEKKM